MNFFEMDELSVKKDSYIADNTAMEADSDVIVDFNNVTFAYDDKNCVEELKFSVKEGEQVTLSEEQVQEEYNIQAPSWALRAG